MDEIVRLQILAETASLKDAEDKLQRLKADLAALRNTPGTPPATLTGLERAIDRQRFSVAYQTRAVDQLATGHRNLGTSVLIASNAIQDFAAAGMRGVTNNVAQFASSLGFGAGLAGVMMVGGVIAEKWGGQIMSAMDPLQRLKDSAQDTISTLHRLGESGERVFGEQQAARMEALAAQGGSLMASMGTGTTKVSRKGGAAAMTALEGINDPAMAEKLIQQQYTKMQDASPERKAAVERLEQLRQQTQNNASNPLISGIDAVGEFVLGFTRDAEKTVSEIDAKLAKAATEEAQKLVALAAKGNPAARSELIAGLEPKARAAVDKALNDLFMDTLDAFESAVFDADMKVGQKRAKAAKAGLKIAEDLMETIEDIEDAVFNADLRAGKKRAKEAKKQEELEKDIERDRDRDRKKQEANADKHNAKEMDRAANLTGINRDGLSQSMAWLRTSREHGGAGMTEMEAVEQAQRSVRQQLMAPKWAGGAGMAAPEAGVMAARMVAEAAPGADEALRDLADTFPPSAKELAEQIKTNNEVQREILRDGVRISLGRNR